MKFYEPRQQDKWYNNIIIHNIYLMYFYYHTASWAVGNDITAYIPHLPSANFTNPYLPQLVPQDINNS